MTEPSTSSPASPEFNRADLIQALNLALEVLHVGSPHAQQSMLDSLNLSDSFRFFVACSNKANSR